MVKSHTSTSSIAVTWAFFGLIAASYSVTCFPYPPTEVEHHHFKTTANNTFVNSASSKNSADANNNNNKEKKSEYNDVVVDDEPPPRSPKEIVTRLRDLYVKKLRPIERKYCLSMMLPWKGEIQEAEFTSNPMVLLLGQYSTGKTTFIRHLMGGRDFPGLHIGAEPTTDKFVAMIYGNYSSDTMTMTTAAATTMIENEADETSNEANTPGSGGGGGGGGKTGRHIFSQVTGGKASSWGALSSSSSPPYEGKIVKGNSLTVIPELPFSSLATYGTAFLEHFEGSVCPAELLEHVTLIDTPGILSGEKQRLARSYSFVDVTGWFADRSDLILLLFDAHKLDISDELKDVIEKIRPYNDGKIRCILNKSDQVSREQLVRVYGSLMWSMGKIFQTPENVRVYCGSYWDKKLIHNDFKDMFRADEGRLVNELRNLPAVAAERKVNEFVKRIRLVKAYVCVLDQVQRKTRGFAGVMRKQWTQTLLTNALREICLTAKRSYSLSEGDLPEIETFAQRLLTVVNQNDFFRMFPQRLDKKILSDLDDLIHTDLPKLMQEAGGIHIGT